jgi:hypothetical protein
MGGRITDPTWRRVREGRQSIEPLLARERVVDGVRAFFKARGCETRIAGGEIPEPAAYDAIPYQDQRSERLTASSSYLRATYDATVR